MNTQKTITINGVAYDAHTGLRTSETVASRSQSTVHVSHKKQARAKTLSRSHVTSPHKVKIAVISDTVKTTKVERSPMIQKFSAPQEKAKAAPVHESRVISDIGPTSHPLQAQAHHVAAIKKAPQAHTAPAEPKPAAQIKQHAIETALKHAKPTRKEKKSFAARHPRLVSVSTASLAIALLGGYLTYINLPNISVRVAAAQAGIAATYPTYQPSGYSLNGPVAYSNGQVSMKFAANVGPQDFTVNQVKSSWDSTALLENYVQENSNGDYQTLSNNGLTIYSYDGNAAWVNGGILHTIEGNAPLSPDQIRRIATSM